MGFRIERNEPGKPAELFTDARLNDAASLSPENRKTTAPPMPLPDTDDSVDISDEGRRLAAESGNAAMNAEAGPTASPEAGSSDMDQVRKLREQIRELQEKIREAQERLLEAQADSGADGADTADDSALMDQKAMAGLAGQSAEARRIQTEIEMLNQQLLTLNDQLKEAMQGQ